MMSVFYIAAGGALGAIMRYGMMCGMTRLAGFSFPYGTLVVNVIGSLAMGLLIGALAKHSSLLGLDNSKAHLFLAVGVLGSFTTFSTFSLDVVALFQRGETLSVLAYILASVILSIVALYIGLRLA